MYENCDNYEPSNRTKYSYDAANRIASVTYPSGSSVSYTRDTMGRVTAVNARPSGGTSTPVVSSVSYQPFGPYSGLTYGNGVTESRGFDQDYRLTGIADTGASTLQNLTYGYYPTNNVQTITDAVNSGNSQGFSYDNLQRLSNATGGYGSFGFTYDKDGNRLSQTVGATTTTYGYGTGSDLLATLSVGGVQTQAIGYTADGRIGSLSPGIQAPGGQYITSLSYNQDARLASVNAAGGALASYTYDGFGQRSIKTISVGNGEIYQYGQDGMLLEETNASGSPQADYIYLDGRPIATMNPATGALYFLHDDMLGTPQLATDPNKTVAWQASYQPFGTTSSVSGTITQNLRFPGQYFDVESSWDHNGFRDYIPDLGRYAEPDPVSMLGSRRFYNPVIGRFAALDTSSLSVSSASTYSYVTNDPLNFIDPFGLTALTFVISTGQLVVDPQQAGKAPYVIKATSGNQGCMNNPSCSNRSDHGPIPPGIYNLNTSEISEPSGFGDIARLLRSREDWGSFRVPLHAGPFTNTFGRSGFFLHGGIWPGSAGCIDAGGGLFGDDSTNRLLQDLRNDPDGNVPLVVFPTPPNFKLNLFGNFFK